MAYYNCLRDLSKSCLISEFKGKEVFFDKLYDKVRGFIKSRLYIHDNLRYKDLIINVKEIDYKDKNSLYFIEVQKNGFYTIDFNGNEINILIRYSNFHKTLVIPKLCTIISYEIFKHYVLVINEAQYKQAIDNLISEQFVEKYIALTLFLSVKNDTNEHKKILKKLKLINTFKRLKWFYNYVNGSDVNDFLKTYDIQEEIKFKRLLKVVINNLKLIFQHEDIDK